MKKNNENKILTAAVLVIGDEVLSGRTKEKNIGYIADFLTLRGIDLKEARIVADEQDAIVSAVNSLRQHYDFVFTTGGIGPTHDDITADAIAAAFDKNIDEDERAMACLRERYTEEELNIARRRMARIPEGADLIENPMNKAPGFIVENVYVLAGVPKIMQSMLDVLDKVLPTSEPVSTQTIDVGVKEGDVANSLREIAQKIDEVQIGSYPFFDGSGFRTRIVCRSRNQNKLDEAVEEISKMVETFL